MTFPEWMKPAVYGALGGAIAVSFLGFSWGGWTTSGSAQEMAQNLATQEVALAMVPVCLNKAAGDPDRAEKLVLIEQASRFNRRTALMDTGWATQPGTDAPNRDLAIACLAGLELDG